MSASQILRRLLQDESYGGYQENHQRNEHAHAAVSSVRAPELLLSGNQLRLRLLRRSCHVSDDVLVRPLASAITVCNVLKVRACILASKHGDDIGSTWVFIQEILRQVQHEIMHDHPAVLGGVVLSNLLLGVLLTSSHGDDDDVPYRA